MRLFKVAIMPLKGLQDQLNTWRWAILVKLKTLCNVNAAIIYNKIRTILNLPSGQLEQKLISLFLNYKNEF